MELRKIRVNEDLREMAQYCDFNSLKKSSDPTEESVKVALIAGLEDSLIKSKVLEKMCNHDNSTGEILEYIQQLEHVSKFVENECSPMPYTWFFTNETDL